MAVDVSSSAPERENYRMEESYDIVRVTLDNASRRIECAQDNSEFRLSGR